MQCALPFVRLNTIKNMSNYLNLTFVNNLKPLEKINHYEFRNKPFSNSDVFLVTIENFKLLTQGQDVKRVYNLKLSTMTISYNFLPGDTIGILPRNDDREVDEILIRLNIESDKEKLYELGILENTTKKSATLPKHIPRQGVLKDIFTYYIDIRKPPKKLFLKALIPFTRDPEEISLLEKLCSPKGSNEYADLITGKAHTLLGLLNTFPSCNPPIGIILEHSLPLQPRYYSISSSPLENNALQITFFIVDNDDGTKGVCSGWLEEIIRYSDKQIEKIPIYFRKPNNFRIPTDTTTPLIMISTGTGIAPFIGFLNHRQKMKINDNGVMGNTYLFYGCRYPDRDFLYHNELEEYLKTHVLTKLYTAFSRSTEKKWYVQDEMNKNGEELVNNILRNGAIVYVCGDAKTTVKGVKDALINNLVVHGHLEESAAKDYLNELVKENRFITDCWS
ncbi:methionine synthase reductase-like [Anoplophora glabripennis]|uniref:methionine synthase reductase-like n=1 Tax=Anoplophora glabripennis TaxID=217634 RepID=UPI000873748C|nr:methionine synthase reductase-like [Anoplophora glabripennis]